MFRQPLLPRLVFTLIVGAGIGGTPIVCWAQDRSMDERLDRLERDLNMLQRQVYRGGPPPPMSAGDAGPGAVNTEVRMEHLEDQMRNLTGRVEEFSNQVGQLRQRLEQVNSDIDMRLHDSGGGALAAATPPPPPPRGSPASRSSAMGFPPNGPPGGSLAGPLADADDEPAPPLRKPPGGFGPPDYGAGAGYNPSPGPGGGPTPIFGTLTPPGMAPPGGGPPDMASGAAGTRSGGEGGLPSGSSAEQYNYAFGLLKQANYPAAEAALKAFIEQHPKDSMAGNAQYWLGETFYTRGKYMEAASTFAEGYKRYPKGAKAPDELLKLGMSLARADQKQNACVALGQLDRDFPNPGASIKERASAEKKRLGC
ncbi:MAG: tol-pal system protein YbgF [Alphaproteobacteria bacterium]|nr:tol-pal system protein YbgF [Alphaproteobacteria bacterium]